jgi:SAM-dependent methyltransferase
VRLADVVLPPAQFGAMQRAKQIARGFTWRLTHPGRTHACPFCQREFGQFIPYVNRFPIAVTADIISGQSISFFKCPYCQSRDRERGLYFYIRKQLSLRGKRILHVAPERALHDLIAASGCLDYVCGDINPKAYYSTSRAIHRIDLLSIDFPDGSFDFAICNHILEHIADDRTAMSELFRVLKPQGSAIVQVPIGAKLETTYEDPRMRTADERSRAFGQDTHVRIYAEADYLERLRSVGFETRADSIPISPADFARYGIDPREKVYLALKPTERS